MEVQGGVNSCNITVTTYQRVLCWGWRSQVGSQPILEAELAVAGTHAGEGECLAVELG